MKKDNRKTALTILFMALAIGLSPFTSIPLGIAKINPTQHFVNLFLAVLTGTGRAVGAAAGISIIRNAMGVGTLLAFPGSLPGALLASLFYRLTGKFSLAALGELMGTGLLGPLLGARLIAPAFMGKEIAFAALFPGFFLSSLAGGILALVVLYNLDKAHVLDGKTSLQS